MTYQVNGEAGKIAGQLNHLAHPVNVMDPELQDVFVKMVKEGITVLSKPTGKTKKNIFADAAKTIPYHEATPAQIISELHFQGFEVVPEAETSV